MNGLREYFEVGQISGGQLTETQIREIITEGCRQTAEDLANRIKVKLDLGAVAGLRCREMGDSNSEKLIASVRILLAN
jgi:hypothetical protein